MGRFFHCLFDGFRDFEQYQGGNLNTVAALALLEQPSHKKSDAADRAAGCRRLEHRGPVDTIRRKISSIESETVKGTRREKAFQEGLGAIVPGNPV